MRAESPQGRHVPIKTLTRKLHVEQYDHPAPYREFPVEVRSLALPLKQSAGTAAVPKVRAGDRVSQNQLLAEPPADVLGAFLHAPFPGVVREVDSTSIVLERG